jgi:phenylacetate-coenzyme A ligase PaaK-like adenylate-forming protein
MTPLMEMRIRPIIEGEVLITEQHQNEIDSALTKLASIASRSKFYAERLAGHHIQSTVDLEKIEPVTPADLSKYMYPADTVMSTGPFIGGFVLKSGGSTGIPKYSIFDKSDLDAMIDYAVPILKAMGLEQGDRVANCLFVGDLYGGLISLEHENFRLGATSFAMGAKIEPENFLKAWKDFSINAVEGQPGTLMPLLRQVKAMEPEFHIDKVIFGGSAMSVSDVEWLKVDCKAKRVASVLAANDGGQFGYQCEHMDHRLHHAVDDYNYIEIVDDNGKRVPDGQAGKILITSLRKFAFPLIRYEIGDVGRMIPGMCKCGRSDRRFEFLGRTSDSFIMGGAINRITDYKEALTGFAVSGMQLEAATRDHRDHLILRVETSHDLTAEQVMAAIFEKMPILKRNVNERHHEFSVEIHGVGYLERNNRSGKIREFLDNRASAI